MPFVKGNTIGAATRFKTGQSGNPAGRPEHRTYKLGSGITSEYGHYVKSPREP